MSLKAIHILFITCATLMLMGFAAWFFHEYSGSRARADLIWGVVSAVGAVVLVWYGKYFLKKLRNVGYL